MVDLFLHINELPEDVRHVCEKYADIELEYGLTCDDLILFEEELKPLGYIFDWGLSLEPFNLRKIES